MRIAAIGAILLLLPACSTTDQPAESTSFQNPNSLMAGEITSRVEQIPYQHRDELLENLLWLTQQGEQTIPALLQGLRSDNAKSRSSCAWVLGRLRDRRTIPNLQTLMRDGDPSVRMEAARSLVTMGDLNWSSTLIEGLDSERKEVRYLCHEALKVATGHDFGYDHLNANETELRMATLRWRQWWGEYSGDTMFAQSYQRQHNLQPSAPAGETQPADPTNVEPNTGEPKVETPEGKPIEVPSNGNEPMPMPAPIPAPQPPIPAPGSGG